MNLEKRSMVPKTKKEDIETPPPKQHSCSADAHSTDKNT